MFNVMNSAAGEWSIDLYAPIGESFWADAVSAKAFAAAMDGISPGDTLNVRINSPGGDVHDGLAIYNRIHAHPGKTVVTIDGLAASIASVIAMAGKVIRAPENAMVMIHDPWATAIGNAAEMRKVADVLDAHKESILTTYANRTQARRADLSRWMRDETWMDGKTAKERGFIDELLPLAKPAAQYARADLIAAGFRPPENYGETPDVPVVPWRRLAAKRRLAMS